MGRRMRKPGKRGKVLLMLAGAAGLLGGCQAAFTPQESQAVAEDMVPPDDDSLVVVGVSQLGSESVWRTAHTASIQRAFTKENGYFLIFENARQKQENQIKSHTELYIAAGRLHRVFAHHGGGLGHRAAGGKGSGHSGNSHGQRRKGGRMKPFTRPAWDLILRRRKTARTMAGGIFEGAGSPGGGYSHCGPSGDGGRNLNPGKNGRV